MQRHLQFINLVQFLLARRVAVWILAVAGFVLTGLSLEAQGVQHQTITLPGGMPGLPIMTGVQQTTNGVQITWDGPSGYYQIWQKQHLTDSTWLAIGKATNLSWTATITNIYSNDFFRVSGPGPQYAGFLTCAGCHGNIYNTVISTAHAQAFQALQQINQSTNPSCLPCHTVGYGLTTGFTDALHTPQLEGVQCENCHGPAGNHAAIPEDPTTVPRVDLAAQVCGGCHSAGLTPAEVVAHHPVGFSFEDWSISPHSAVVPAVLNSMSSSVTNINNCGRCHSGSARLALVQGQNPSVTLTNDYNVAITCAVCHDPHTAYVWSNELYGVIAFTNQLTGNVVDVTNDELGLMYTNQLLYPLSSLVNYSLPAETNFASVYNPYINICAQCHNDRGADWQQSDSPPHHSPQYNMMLGTVGVLADGTTSPNFPSTHSRLEMQCAACHMQTATNNASGHTFQVATYQLCFRCHTDPAGLVQSWTNNISDQIQLTKALLDLWATNTAPVFLQTNYGTLAWEYTLPGDLSSGGTGPSAMEQTNLIPVTIRQARFDLYLVFYDGSYGVHNAPYDAELLQTALNWIEGQLYQ